jgi:arginine/lysine/ornithine decarboxylase
MSEKSLRKILYFEYKKRDVKKYQIELHPLKAPFVSMSSKLPANNGAIFFEFKSCHKSLPSSHKSGTLIVNFSSHKRITCHI